jgi:hypothetical protein
MGASIERLAWIGLPTSVRGALEVPVSASEGNCMRIRDGGPEIMRAATRGFTLAADLKERWPSG